MRELINLVCSGCKRRNYLMDKNKKNTKEKLGRNKFCRFCRKHTLHKEDKVG